ncbi:hypothetical protein KBI23_05550 [bacterium]|nr:hypothetical protein [bacterium]MBP9810592.1 hypothetical protein [bacterium]
METTQTLTHFTQFQVGLGIIIVLAGLTWYIASASVKRKWNRYSQAEAEATKIRDLVVETYNSFRGKYMPPALRELLTEAWADYSSIAQRSHDVSSNEQLVAVTNEVDEVLERIGKQALIVPTLADFEADKLALVHEVVELRSKYEDSLGRLERDFNSKNEHIAQRRKQLDEQLTALKL